MLRAVDLFSSELGEEGFVEDITSRMRDGFCIDGDTVFAEGDPGTSLVFLVQSRRIHYWCILK